MNNGYGSFDEDEDQHHNSNNMFDENFGIKKRNPLGDDSGGNDISSSHQSK